MFSIFNTPKLTARKLLIWALLAAALGTLTLVTGQSAIPLINLASEPLYINGAKSKANLTLALSVEKPTVGQTYRDNYDPAKKYVGYFDSMFCYRQVPASAGSSKGSYFDIGTSGNKLTLAEKCKSSTFDGNFMNWATSSAIDIFRYGLTGGNRTSDDTDTVVERAWLPDDFYRNPSLFSEKYVPLANFDGRTELSISNFPNGVWIYNCKNRIYFAKAKDDPTVFPNSSCSSPFGISADTTTHPFLYGNTKTPYYEVRNLVCDSSSAKTRLVSFDPLTKRWSGLCKQYGTNFKPVGQLQLNADSLRVSVFSYLQDNSEARYGGVMRSPLKYVGPNRFDQSFNLIAGVNPSAEWSATTGVLVRDPQASDPDPNYRSQGYPVTGAINYINRFGTLGMDPSWTISTPARIAYQSTYKINDPVSELYYEALRYLQGKTGATSNAVTGLTDTASTDKALSENFPAYRAWTDPFAGFVDSTGTSNGCMRNSIASIADVFTTYDRSLPGNSISNTGDFSRPADTLPALDVPLWTSIVGGFESGNAVAYTDGQGRAQTTFNLSGNTKYPWLADAATRTTGAGAGTTSATLTTEGNAGGSYHLAGLAYWANTHSFRADFPKARVKTFAIDVNQSDASALNADFRRSRQLYLSAKYGGFEDSQASSTGNPYEPGSNVLWQGTDGDANNYFLASDAQKFLDSLSELFARVVEETGSIAGGAISTTRLTSSASSSVFQARFNPVANFWSGRVLRFPVTLSATNSIVLSSTPTWEAGDLLTTATRLDNGAARNLVIGPPIGRQGTDAATAFTWSSLVQAHKDSFNITASGIADLLGEKRVNYLRGDQRDEESAANPSGLFRPRDIVLGDVINSGLVYQGAPDPNIAGTDYRSFFDANKNRKPVIYVNANDGMLHAFYEDNGAEAFGYVPGFIARNLNKLPDVSYTHATFADSTPATSEAYFGGKWRTALVSGVGGGGRGVYALDVTNPQTFSKDNALWEFTEQDHPAMGNVIGSPQILKFRVPASSSASPTYKWFAVVPSGVNNYMPGTAAYSSGNPSLFLLDLEFVPTATQKWVEGTNFWRIEFPLVNTAIAKGLVGFSSDKNQMTGAVNALYAGDLQGNMWKLDFSMKGTSLLVSNAATNFDTFNPLPKDAAGFRKPMYIAKSSDNSLQPITGEPIIVNSLYGKKLVTFGTGKFLETTDTTVPLAPAASFYSVLDADAQVADRASLQPGSVSASGAVTVPSFTLGATPSVTPNIKAGWYVDFNAALGERQISDITLVNSKLAFGSIFPTQGSCGEGGGRIYIVDALTGNGQSEVSQVGILAAPLAVELGSAATFTRSDNAGRRIATRTTGVITQGTKGLQASSLKDTYSYQIGRMSWRRIDNYQSTKANP